MWKFKQLFLFFSVTIKRMVLDKTFEILQEFEIKKKKYSFRKGSLIPDLLSPLRII